MNAVAIISSKKKKRKKPANCIDLSVCIALVFLFLGCVSILIMIMNTNTYTNMTRRLSQQQQQQQYNNKNAIAIITKENEINSIIRLRNNKRLKANIFSTEKSDTSENAYQSSNIFIKKGDAVRTILNPPVPVLPTTTTSAKTEIYVGVPLNISKQDVESAITREAINIVTIHHHRQRQHQRLLQHNAEDCVLRTEATEMSCSEIFIPPAQIPPLVDTCYRVVITVKTKNMAEANVLVVEINMSVEDGTFTKDLKCVTVVVPESRSIAVTGVPMQTDAPTATMSTTSPTNSSRDDDAPPIGSIDSPSSTLIATSTGSTTESSQIVLPSAVVTTGSSPNKLPTSASATYPGWTPTNDVLYFNGYSINVDRVDTDEDTIKDVGNIGRCRTIHDILIDVGATVFSSLLKDRDINFEYGEFTVFASPDLLFVQADISTNLNVTVSDVLSFHIAANVVEDKLTNDLPNSSCGTSLLMLNTRILNQENSTTICAGGEVYQLGPGNRAPAAAPRVVGNATNACNGVVYTLTDSLMLPTLMNNVAPTTKLQFVTPTPQTMRPTTSPTTSFIVSPTPMPVTTTSAPTHARIISLPPYTLPPNAATTVVPISTTPSVVAAAETTTMPTSTSSLVPPSVEAGGTTVEPTSNNETYDEQEEMNNTSSEEQDEMNDEPFNEEEKGDEEPEEQDGFEYNMTNPSDEEEPGEEEADEQDGSEYNMTNPLDEEDPGEEEAEEQDGSEYNMTNPLDEEELGEEELEEQDGSEYNMTNPLDEEELGEEELEEQDGSEYNMTNPLDEEELGEEELEEQDGSEYNMTTLSTVTAATIVMLTPTSSAPVVATTKLTTTMMPTMIIMLFMTIIL